MRKESSLRVFLLLLAVMVAAAPAPGRVKAVSSVDRPVVLAFGGDVHFEGRLSGVGSLVSMAALLRADFSVVNFETSVGRGGSPEGKTYVFRAEGRHVRALVDAGVDAVAVANNHFFDYGAASAMDGLRVLERAGLPSAGSGVDLSGAVTPVVLGADPGRQVALFSVTTREPFSGFGADHWVAGEGKPGLLFWENHRRPLLRAIARERAAGRHPVVMVHWGRELGACPTALQRLVGRALVDAGAVAVVGTHPHVLGPVEVYRGAVLAYSLGNFVWYHRRPAETAALVVSVDSSGVATHRVRPALIGFDGVPRRVHGEVAERIVAMTNRVC